VSTDITNLPQLDSMSAALERMAKDASVPTERITSLFELAERRERTIQRRAFNYDMNLMQAELQQITKDKPNPAFHSRYATEEAIDRAARPIYTKYGFSIRFGTVPASKPDNIQVVCTVAHSAGFYEEHALEGPVSVEGSRGGRIGATPIQAVGATITYLKRALIKMVLNLVTADDPTDDDGEGQRRSHVQRPLSERPPAWDRDENQPPPPPQERNGQQRLAVRFDKWESDSIAATTEAEMESLLRDDFAVWADEKLAAISPTAWERYDRVKLAMINRISPVLVGEGEKPF
jgi:hypothetical protein